MNVELILASSSPRRQDLLKSASLNFRIIVPQVVEERLPGELAEPYATRNSQLKCDWVCQNLPKELRSTPVIVLSADTIVVLGSDVLEKPRDVAHACEMLRQLSDRTHQVMTGFTLQSVNVDNPKSVSRVIKTNVTFKPLSDSEIRSYVATGEPMDKAGSYGAQGGAGYLIRRIEGSYTNVIGLPVAEVLDELASTFANEWQR